MGGKPKMRRHKSVSHGRHGRKGRRNQKQKGAREYGSDYQGTGVDPNVNYGGQVDWIGRENIIRNYR